MRKLCSICEAEGACTGYFGFCPICHKTDSYLNVGRSHIFYCREHRKAWCVGSNLFSSWRFETEEEQRRQYDEIGIGDFERIEEYHPPDCIGFQPADEAREMREKHNADGADEIPF